MTPLPTTLPSLVTTIAAESGIQSLAKASIREVVALVNKLEQASGVDFIRMEMGVPGLNAPTIGIEAEVDALRAGVAAKYPMIEGIAPLKAEISRFCRQFLNVEVKAEGCFPTVGAAQGAMATFLIANRLRPNGKTLFIDPGFPNQKRQLTLIGQQYGSFDVYAHRGEKLRTALESHLCSGEYTTLLYSNPNNPAWICFDEQELQIIADVAHRYDVIVIEDLAYFGMDYRSDYSTPGEAPYQPTIAHYSDNYILLISSSKVFSYAGQRIGSLVISDALFHRHTPQLVPFTGQTTFGKAMIFGALHGLSSGVTHSTQYGLAAMLKAANDGTLPFLAMTRVYEQRAHIMKNLFTQHGFELVYDQDNGAPLSDGFYFTIAHPQLSGDELMQALLSHGISALSLANTGSEQIHGVRACVSQVTDAQLATLEQRLTALAQSLAN
ncbi:pyridoxal phosphate-dependent aminotransferase [Maribrevibacterium harenarium]|uniref:Pyridoxal phosphate-dependent aminotransferase n=1 Tax=Maribrevibacterium harenarium TaxID=2589817 RepID=A0A501WED1_9GAMM|nr:pyridoxal phosphate-dependent aminotransferase [Maribrevibacterium harenarium]TPE46865.1 pyridoxal phosphate-dependent aminotransferase [Maribrevibacterium harenarium]